MKVGLEGRGEPGSGPRAAAGGGAREGAWTTLVLALPLAYPSQSPSCWFNDVPEGFVVGEVQERKQNPQELVGGKQGGVTKGVISWEELRKRKEAWLEMQAVMAEEPVGDLEGLVMHWVAAVTAVAA